MNIVSNLTAILATIGISIIILAAFFLLSRNLRTLVEKLFVEQQHALKLEQIANAANINANLQQQAHATREQLLQHMRLFTEENHKQQLQNLTYLNENLTVNLKNYSADMAQNFTALTKTADTKLQEISAQVEKRLNDGFNKTNETFLDIVKRLALIDNAQQKLTELSSNIISLQDILTDKRSRGAFGEVQLKNLIENMLTPKNYALQHSLSNNTRVDCMLFLPPPTGNIGIDAKFPLENFSAFTSQDLPLSERQRAQQNFKIDIKRHISAIASKYIIPNETADAAVMFLPSEAIFAEIHRNFAELIEFAYKNKVFIASPTTMMAILTTASSVIKDAETRKHVHIIKENLYTLSQDFTRFEQRMQKLTVNLERAHDNATAVNTSAKKIAAKFRKIESVSLVPKAAEDTKVEKDEDVAIQSGS
jgi:DNA recombination protein RmuC